MAWYAYCITDHGMFHGSLSARRPVPLDGIHGISGAQVLGYPSGEFAVIVSEHACRMPLDQRALFEHARVIGECFRTSTVLPFRFGTVFDDDEALRRAVPTNRRTFGDSVAALRGKAEMHLKLTVHEEPSPRTRVFPTEAAAGSEYLTELRLRAAREREAQTKARALSVKVHKLFGPVQEEVSCKKVESGGFSIDMAHLIDSKSVSQYQCRCSAAARQIKGCALAITGPWPPYHFMPGKLRTVNC